MALTVLDHHFARRFRALLANSQTYRRPSRQRPLILASIGTLGPGGAERQLVNTLRGLKRRYDVDIEVVTMYLEVEWQRFFLAELLDAGIRVSGVAHGGRFVSPEGIPAESVSVLDQALSKHLPADLGHVAAYAAIFAARQPDVVHLWLDEVNIKGGLAAVLCGVPRVVLSMRSVNPSHFVFYQPYMRSGYRVLLERPEVHALNNSAVGARDYAEWLGVELNTITVIRNGVDFSGVAPLGGRDAARRAYRRSHGIPSNAFVMGGVMRLTEEKRPLLWLEVAALVAESRPDVRFVLVGDGTQRPQVEARIDALGLRTSVTAVGHEQRPFDSMAAMDVLFLSSVFEGSPNVLIEAQALGLPVVTIPAGGAIEAVDDGRSGWVVHSGTAREAADRIVALSTDAALWERTSRNAVPFVHARFGLDRMVDETAGVYGGLPRLLGRSAAGPGEA